MRIFHGIEAEGPWKGCSSLFVADPTVTIGELISALEKSRSLKIEQIYFGAGNNRQVPAKDILESLPGLAKRYRLIFEIESPAQLDAIPKYLLKFIDVVLCIQIEARQTLENIRSVKLFGQGTLSWLGPVNPVITDLSDPLYDQDKEIL